ncbi:MAG TPA: sugar ABC transporter permease [Acidimicrobiales bacterium]|nr:sugar ABC transporter permease [Acidimicrobiales bacterium]
MTRVRRWGPGLLLVLPSIVLIAVFVYGLIGWNIKTSLGPQPITGGPRGLENYTGLWDEARWIRDVKNLAVFTVVFILGSLVMGAVMALLLDKGVKGEGFFRSIYLFPMAVSFIAAGIVWRWLLNPSSGLNLILDKVGLDSFQSQWWQSTPPWGMAAIAMPAVWQMSGYIMALYLAGFRGVPEELREAARMDGAAERQVYRHVVFPHLRPVTLSALVILGHISIKVFDLILAVSGKQGITETPAVYMWDLIFQASNRPKGAAIATLLLIGVAVLIIPYLVYTVRSERQT